MSRRFGIEFGRFPDTTGVRITNIRMQRQHCCNRAKLFRSRMRVDRLYCNLILQVITLDLIAEHRQRRNDIARYAFSSSSSLERARKVARVAELNSTLNSKS